jgi:hypothetical protein
MGREGRVRRNLEFLLKDIYITILRPVYLLMLGTKPTVVLSSDVAIKGSVG